METPMKRPRITSEKQALAQIGPLVKVLDRQVADLKMEYSRASSKKSRASIGRSLGVMRARLKAMKSYQNEVLAYLKATDGQ